MNPSGLRKFPLAAVPLLALACTDNPEPVDVEVSALTAVIPTSKTCNQGLGPKQCIQVPPIESTSLARWQVDGTRTQHEYYGATELPYTLDTRTLGGNGRVRVQRVTHTGLAPVGYPRNFLYVYLEDILVPVLSSGPSSKVHVYLDYKRFDGATEYAEAPDDRRLVLDLATGGSAITQGVSGSGGSLTWTSILTPTGLTYAAGGCKVAANGASARCKGELRIPLHASALTAPEAEAQPGMGFFVRHSRELGSAPEVDDAVFGQTWQRRTLWPTLLFGPPRGFPLRVMTWNVRRFGTDLMSPAFAGVSEDDIGTYLALHDVVAIQEGWDQDKVAKIQQAANAVRAGKGLPPFKLYGPVDFTPSWRSVMAKLASIVNDTSGGLFILSHLDAANTGSTVFPPDSCRGEDCFQAKGVQWVRLLLNTPAAADPTCLKYKNTQGTSCDKLPSGDDYVDVFNTHMQAEDPALCMADSEWAAEKHTILGVLASLGPPFTTIFAAALSGVIELVEADLNCPTLTDRDARRRQLVHMNAFIEAITSEREDRPALVMGDFNIDGKLITAAEYRDMLQLLEIASPQTPDSDVVSPLPAGFTWDIDHGDLARERTDINFTTGRCLGTSIGEDEGDFDSECTMAGMFDADQRLDFILLRPPVRATEATADPRWFAVRGAEPWRSPYPTLTGVFGAPPDRLSDHKPVITDITFAPLSTPPQYHAHWRHDVELRVVGVDATSADDCIGCSAVDPYAKLVSVIEPSNATVHKTTTECTDQHSLVYGWNGCMNDWFIKRGHLPPDETAVDLTSEVWEDDNSSDDDPLDGNTRSRLRYDRGDGVGEYQFTPNLFGAPLPTETWPVFDSEPLGTCDDFAPIVCHRVTLTEKPPGQ